VAHDDSSEFKIFLATNPSSVRWWFSKIEPPSGLNNPNFFHTSGVACSRLTTLLRSWGVRRSRLISLTIARCLSAQVITRVWFCKVKNKRTILMLHDNLEPLGRSINLLPKDTFILNYWWNDAAEATAAAKQYSAKMKDRRVIHIACQGDEQIIPDSQQEVKIWRNFCLMPLEQGVLNECKLENTILFFGELRLDLPGIALKDGMDGHFNQRLWRVAEELAFEGVRNWPRLKVEHELESRYQANQLFIVDGDRVDFQLDYVIGNRLRFFLIQSILQSDLGALLRLAGPSWKKAFPQLKEENQLNSVPNHKANQMYRRSRVTLDFGSRSLDSPIECYERSSQIITNGPGFFRLKDYPESRLLKGVESDRGFFGAKDLQRVIGAALGSSDAEYFSDARRIAANYNNLRLESWGEIKDFVRIKERDAS